MQKRKPEAKRSESPEGYIAEIMRREAEAAARQPPRRRSRLPLLIGAFVLVIAMTAVNVIRLAGGPDAFSAAQEEAALRFTIYLTAQGIEAYRDSTGGLPESLAELGLDGDGLAYVRESRSAYTLTGDVGTMRLTYRRGDDLARFAVAYEELVGGHEP